jgi:biopolymer transport protein ExbB/TolQ/DNA-directed RNA polymerase subunit RPC12/RpoP
MIFTCPTCNMQLKAEPEQAGHLVRCPGCNSRLEIPPNMPDSVSTQAGSAHRAATRQVWKETDPTNPNMFLSLGVGVAILAVWFAILSPFNPSASKAISSYTAMEYLASLFFKHFLVSFLNTLFFSWAIAILYLKYQKLRHQRAALLLDVLPMQLGREIHVGNVGQFIDHVYKLPRKLRDSLMVNRIRKALELFEGRPSVSDVREMMASQSDIDSARIGGSYTLSRAFLWAIPLLGFIGTVLGLSQAIGGMNFANVEDVGKIVSSINNVTSGLGTAFDATLLGLVLAMMLNFPINSISKQEDDNLNAIDAFCNEVLLPRLNDGVGAGNGDTGAIADAVVKQLANAHHEFLTDLNALSSRMVSHATHLDEKMAEFQKTVSEEFVTKTTAMREESDKAIKDSMAKVSEYLNGLQMGIHGLNDVLARLGEKQIVIRQARRKWPWSRDDAE